MRNDYPKFKKGKKGEGELQKIKKTLSKKNLEIINEFVKHCLATVEKDKAEKIERVLLQFIYVTEKDLDEITKLDVDCFLALLNKSGRTKWTRNEVKIYLKKFLLWKYKDVDLVSNIKCETKCFNEEKINEGNLITKEEAEKLVRCAEKLRDKAIVMLLFETGVRPQELQILRWKNIKFEENYADVIIYAPKTGQSRTFPVKDSVVHLKRWQQEFCYPNVKSDDYIFPSPINRKKPVRINTFNWLLKQLAKKAEIPNDRIIFPYLFRHTRATKLYEELPQQIVEKLLGHKNMAEIYAHISSKKAKEEMLKKIYHIEEFTEEQKNKYEKAIENLTQEIEKMKTWKETFSKAYEELFNLNVEAEGLDTKEGLKSLGEMIPLAKRRKK